VLRLAVVAFQDDSLAVLAIVIAQVFVEEVQAWVLTDARSRMEPLEATDHRPLAFTSSAGTEPHSPAAQRAMRSRQERDVLHDWSSHSNKRIARTLEISPETVKSHVKHLLEARRHRCWRAVSRVSLGLL
jgi:DNA-binding NarL/FixJ family response regulator